MEIRNEIKQKDEDKKQFVHRSLAEVQRAKLNKLMENPDKPVVIPEFVNKKDKEYNAPSFVRNVMGSSAGAGSGEFHVYRHLRRKENARQKYMKTQCETERLDTEFQQKLDDNERLAEAKTNKKREKRKKKKANARNKGKKPKLEEDKEESEELSNDEEDEDEVEQAEKDPVECVSEQVEKDPVSEQNEEKIEEKPVVVENVIETSEKVENKEEVSTKEDE